MNLKEKNIWDMVNGAPEVTKKDKLTEIALNLLYSLTEVVKVMKEMEPVELIELLPEILKDEEVNENGKELMALVMLTLNSFGDKLLPEEKKEIKAKLLTLVPLIPKEILASTDQLQKPQEEAIASEVAVDVVATSTPEVAVSPTPISEINAPDRVVPSADLLAKGFSAT